MVAQFAEIYKTIWRRHAKGAPPEHFDVGAELPGKKRGAAPFRKVTGNSLRAIDAGNGQCEARLLPS